MNKNILVWQIVGLSAFTVLAGCRGGAGSNNVDSLDFIDSMSSVEKNSIVEIRLPDTVYASAEKIDYKIEYLDTVTPGALVSTADLYNDTPGAFTFRKGSRRDADFGGKVDSRPSGFNVEWKFNTAEKNVQTSLGRWGGGTGWSGQLVYVEWPDSILSKMKESKSVYEDFSGKEVIFGGLSGDVYFLDFVTGKPSRKEMTGVNPIKGSVSLDPTLNGNLYIGQGVPVERPFGGFGINLLNNEKFFYLPEDPKAYRRWGAMDASQLRVGQFLFINAENGGIYKMTVAPGEVKKHSVLRYKINGAAPGIECSMAVYGNYGVTGDNHGNILAVNLDNMRPVWLYILGDDTDASPVITAEDGVPYVYVCSEIDRQGTEGTARLAKLKVEDGREVWRKEMPGKKFTINEKHFDGGFYATPLPGAGNCEDKIFMLFVKNSKGQNGALLAINRKTGEVMYETDLKRYAWSSPVRFMDNDNRMYMIVADCAGNMYLFDAEKGELIFEEKIGNNFESSPVVVGNSLVVGSRGNGVYKITLK